MSASSHKQRKQTQHGNPRRLEIKLGALLGPLAWDIVSQEESRYRTEVGLAPLLDARNMKGHLTVPFFFRTLAARPQSQESFTVRCSQAEVCFAT